MRFELTTFCLGSRRSTPELHPHGLFVVGRKAKVVKLNVDQALSG